MTKSILIASSGQVNENLYGDLGKILTSHIPISGKLAINELLKQTEGIYLNKYVMLDKNALHLTKYIEKTFGAKVIVSDYNYSLSQALNQALLSVVHEVSNLDIIFGDTYKSDLFMINEKRIDAIYVSNALDSTAWMKVSREDTNSKLLFESKDTVRTKKFRVSGSFKISELKLFTDLLNQEIVIGLTDKTFWNTWIKYDELQKYSVNLIVDDAWSDIGHIDTYYGARRSLIFSASRAFNSISLSSDMDRVVKSGTESKINEEKKWFENLPVELKKYTPKTYTSKHKSTYEVDYTTVIPLNEMWIAENDDDSYWLSFAVKFREMLAELHKPIGNHLSIDKMVLYKREMYIRKVLTRIELFLKSSTLSIDFDTRISVDNYRMPSINQVISGLNDLVEKLSKSNYWSIIHGDLCFSNIFYDRRKNQIKLIDPRGSFGETGIYGDPVYDLAKFSHSALGNYDYLACDLYTLEGEKNDFILNIAAPQKELISRKTLKNELIDHANIYELNLNEIRLLESTLFLSAAALHTESNRGLALFLKGLQIAEIGLN
jgi:hypothetical protein